MSLFDKPKKILNPAVFTLQNKMRPDTRLYILEDLNKITPRGLIVGLYMLGSMAGHQYNDNSDIDINLVLRPGLNRNDYKEYFKAYNGRNLPGTNHPINYHIQNYSEPHWEDAEYGVYDIVHDTWANPPKKFEELRDPEKEFDEEINYAKMYAKTLTDEEKRKFLHSILEKQRKQIYNFGWGTPRELQQNILYKYIEKLINKQ